MSLSQRYVQPPIVPHHQYIIGPPGVGDTYRYSLLLSLYALVTFYVVVSWISLPPSPQGRCNCLGKHLGMGPTSLFDHHMWLLSPCVTFTRKIHQLYFHHHIDWDAQWHYKVLSRHTPVVVHYPIVSHMRVEWYFSWIPSFLSHNIIKEAICENHFQSIVITDPMLFRRHQTVPHCLFNHYGTEVKLYAKIKISFNQQYSPLLLHLDVIRNLLQY